ncbi:MAG: lipid A deacylase LpxR family protein [Thermoanaerobaculia bacterium]|nr:lipid A deacylase LpxR family protein [Thermoanaerobaculia bacterium]
MSLKVGTARVSVWPVGIVLLLAGWLALPAASQTPPADNASSASRLFRFEFDNDTALGSDDAFSAGWSLQLHTGLDDRWQGPVGQQIGRLPGLGDDGDGGRVVRVSLGISQLMFTPEDLTIAELQPDDVPYAGILGAHVSWSAYDNDQLSALQLYAGCMGPCSQAEEIQGLVHEDLGYGTPAKGWRNQLDTKWLGNLNYAWRRKVVSAKQEDYAPGRWASDLSVGGQVGLGNLAQFVDGQVELRLGWGLPMGFTHIPDPAGRGIVLDPVYVPAHSRHRTNNGWRGYASIVVRAAWIDEMVVTSGGRTENGGHHPGFETNASEPELLLGLHGGNPTYAVHVTYYRYLGQREGGGPGSASDWINLSFERRF